MRSGTEMETRLLLTRLFPNVYVSTLIKKVKRLTTGAIDLMSDLSDFAPTGLIDSEIVVNCTSSQCGGVLPNETEDKAMKYRSAALACQSVMRRNGNRLYRLNYSDISTLTAYSARSSGVIYMEIARATCKVHNTLVLWVQIPIYTLYQWIGPEGCSDSIQ